MAIDNSGMAGERGGQGSAAKTTLIYLAVGFGLLIVGWAVQPRFQARQVTAEMQEVLFPKLEDVAQAGSLEIVSYNEDLAELSPFKVVKTGGVWVLPAHDNYPADAREHLAAAATELIDMKALDVVSTSPADHETFGVIEPDPQKIEAGMTGVGKLVEIRDEAGATLARLVVGKEDRQPAGAAGGTRILRFVRKAGQDPVYRVEIDTSKFTTRFDDWIEKDLLKLSPWDVRTVLLDDYGLAAVQANGRMMVEQQRKSRIRLAYDDQGAEWSLASLEVFDPEKPSEAPQIAELAEGEQLASAKLNDLRNALGDLKIIDVARKPAGLTADLEAEASFLDDDEAVASMQQRGFLPLASGEILSTDGETVVGMKDGVEYVLRFGAGTSVVRRGDESAGDDGGDRDEVPGRYLLVMARFNESLLEKPTLDPLPGEPAATEPEATEPAATEPAATEPERLSLKRLSLKRLSRKRLSRKRLSRKRLSRKPRLDGRGPSGLRRRRMATRRLRPRRLPPRNNLQWLKTPVTRPLPLRRLRPPRLSRPLTRLRPRHRQPARNVAGWSGRIAASRRSTTRKSMGRRSGFASSTAGSQPGTTSSQARSMPRSISPVRR